MFLQDLDSLIKHSTVAQVRNEQLVTAEWVSPLPRNLGIEREGGHLEKHGNCGQQPFCHANDEKRKSWSAVREKNAAPGYWLKLEIKKEKKVGWRNRTRCGILQGSINDGQSEEDTVGQGSLKLLWRRRHTSSSWIDHPGASRNSLTSVWNRIPWHPGSRGTSNTPSACPCYLDWTGNPVVQRVGLGGLGQWARRGWRGCG